MREDTVVQLRQPGAFSEVCLPLTPSDLATLDPCNSRPYAYGRLAPTNSREESNDFCGRRSLREGQALSRNLRHDNRVHLMAFLGAGLRPLFDLVCRSGAVLAGCRCLQPLQNVSKDELPALFGVQDHWETSGEYRVECRKESAVWGGGVDAFDPTSRAHISAISLRLWWRWPPRLGAASVVV